MTYFGFLARFVGLPILILLGIIMLWRRRSHQGQEPFWNSKRAALMILLHVAVALFYTTPWDNYLVATGVWWYDPALVTGITIGWVPIEEYTFFILQPILTGLFLLLMLRAYGPAPAPAAKGTSLRLTSTLGAGALWLLAVLALASGWQPATYLGLELGWALPPIMLQLIYGADILWRYRRAVSLGLLLPTLYLAAADAVAIGTGVWTIDPAQSLHLLLFGILPLEELVFFLLTNTLVVFGVTLTLAPEGLQRVQALRDAYGALRRETARGL